MPVTQNNDPLGILSKSTDNKDPLGILVPEKKNQVGKNLSVGVNGQLQKSSPIVSQSQSKSGYDISQNVPEFNVEKPQENPFNIGNNFGMPKGNQNQNVADNTNIAPTQNVDVENLGHQKAHEQKLQEQNQKVRDAAIDNTVQKSLKLKGINAQKGSLLYNIEKSTYAQQLDNGNASVSVDDKGNAGLKQSTGFWDNFHKTINESREASDFKDMTRKQRIDYADNLQKSEYIGDRPTLLGSAGATTPTLGRYAAGAVLGSSLETLSGGAATPALVPIMTFATNEGTEANLAGMHGTLNRYYSLRQNNPSLSKEDAMKEAEKGEDVDRLSGIAQAGLFSETGNLLGKSVTKSFIKDALKTGVDVGGKTALVEGAKDVGHNIEGVTNKSGTDILKDMGTAFAENAPLGTALHGFMGVLTGIAKASQLIKSGLKYDVVTKMTPEQVSADLDKNVQSGAITQEQADKASSDLADYGKILQTVPKNLSDESKASIAGLIQKRTNIEKEAETKDVTAQPVYKQQIDAINNQISDIQRTGKPLEHEINEATGQTYEKPTFDNVAALKVKNLADKISKGKEISEPEDLQAEANFPDQLKDQLNKISKEEKSANKDKENPKTDLTDNIEKYFKSKENEVQQPTEIESTSNKTIPETSLPTTETVSPTKTERQSIESDLGTILKPYPTIEGTENPLSTGGGEKFNSATLANKLSSTEINGMLSGRDASFMETNVFPAIHDDKIFNSIVRFIPVDMVDNLVGGKFSADKLLHDKSMFLNILASDKDSPISIGLRGITMRALARLGAELSGNTGGDNIKFDATGFAKSLKPSQRDWLISFYNSFSHNESKDNELSGGMELNNNKNIKNAISINSTRAVGTHLGGDESTRGGSESAGMGQGEQGNETTNESGQPPNIKEESENTGEEKGLRGKKVSAAFAGGKINGEVVSTKGDIVKVKSDDGYVYSVAKKDILKEGETVLSHYGEQKAQEPTISEQAKRLAAKIRKGKISKDITLSSIPFAKEVWNGMLEASAKIIEKGGELADAIKAGIDYMKTTDWYKKLSDKDKRDAEYKFEKTQTDETNRFNKWADYAKNSFKSENGKLDFETFKKDFSDKFKLEDSDEIKDIYDEGKKRYEEFKNKPLTEFMSNTSDTETSDKKGKRYVGLIPAIRDFFTSNFNQLGKLSQASKDAAAKYFSSASQANIIIRKAIYEINKQVGKDAWVNLRKAIIQSRLDGIRQRWKDMAASIDNTSDIDLVNSVMKGGKLLDAIEDRTPLENLRQDITALLENSDYDQVRTLLKNAFNYAAGHVSNVDFSDGKSYSEITNSADFKKGLSIYKELVEKPIEQNHASNEGIFSDALGKLDTYFPLIPADKEGNINLSSTNSKLKKAINLNNQFATGLAKAYDISAEKLKEHLTTAIRNNNRSVLVNTLEDAGIMRTISPYDKGSGTLNIDGTIYSAQTLNVGEQRIGKNGEIIPPNKVIVPNWLAHELKPMLENKVIEKSALGRVLDKITSFALGGIFEPAIHTANLIGGIVNGTPFPGTNLLSKSIGNIPITKVFTGIFNAINEDVSGNEIKNVKVGKENMTPLQHLQNMASIGLLPDKTAGVTWSKAFSESTGAKKVGWWNLSPFLYGKKGIDLKARVLMDRIGLNMNPDATPEQRRKFVYQLGNYTRGLEGQLERTVKRNGLAPFFTASSTFLKNGIKGWLGIVPLPTEGLSMKKRIGYKAAQLLSAGAVGVVGSWVAVYKAQTGKYPWEDKDSDFLKIPLTDKQKDYIEGSPVLKKLFYRNGKWQDINFGFFNRPLERGGKALGIEAGYNTTMQGGSPQEIQENMKVQMLNSFLTPLTSSPGLHAAGTLLFGMSPYLTSTRDYITGKPQLSFMPTVRPVHAGLEQLGANALQAAADINPLIGATTNEFGLSLKPDFEQKQDEESVNYLKMITDITMPNLFKPHINNAAKAGQLKKLEKKINRQAGDYQGENSGGAGASGSFKNPPHQPKQPKQPHQ